VLPFVTAATRAAVAAISASALPAVYNGISIPLYEQK